MTKKSPKKAQTLTLHSLLAALSFWGTAARSFLFGIIAAVVLIVALSETSTLAGIDTEVIIFLYVLGCFVLLDFGYVLVARTYPLARGLDQLMLFGADLFLAALYFVPNLVVSTRIQLSVDPLTFAFFVPLVAIAIRILLGMLFGLHRR